MPQSEIRVAVAGLGNVGRAVIRLLQEEGTRFRERLGVPLRLVSVLDRSYRRKDTAWIDPEAKLTDSLEEFLQTPSDIMVELIGGTDPADAMITTSLKQQKAVVTANKLLLAKSARRYLQLAMEHNAYLGFEAAVAGGIPIIRVLRRSLFSDDIVRLRGILNGTCNFILTEMIDSGRYFRDVLTQAQKLGYAEADPYLDVSGRDTADKLAILSLLAFGQSIDPEHIPTQGITEIAPIDVRFAQRFDCALRLLGVAEKNGHALCLRVSPFLIRKRLTLSAVSGVLNAVEVTGTRLGSAVFSGRGAGGDPTAVSVVGDILNAALWKQGEGRPHVPPVLQGEPVSGTETGAVESSVLDTLNSREKYPFYIRCFVNDRPGILAAVASVLARWDININTVVQEPWLDRSNVPFVITVEPTLSSRMDQAVSELKGLDFNRVPPLVLPMLEQ